MAERVTDCMDHIKQKKQEPMLTWKDTEKPMAPRIKKRAEDRQITSATRQDETTSIATKATKAAC